MEFYYYIPKVLYSKTALVCGFLAYVAVVRLLRFRRRDGVFDKYGYQSRSSLAKMSLEDAYKIQLALAELEFPRIFSASVFFALFKTYGIPSISRLLVATGELSDRVTSSRRAAETGIIITEVVLNHPSSKRAKDGIARMNYLHDRYRKAGKISDDDMLYTLSLFALEPIRWTNNLDWRKLTDVERCAMGVYWRWMSLAMEIPCDALNLYMEGPEDGLSWLNALEVWSVSYEAEHMVPHAANQKVAQATLDIALQLVPVILRPFVLKLISALLQPRLRTAMMLAEPQAIHHIVLNAVTTLRKYTVRYLCLPRPSFLRVQWFSTPDPVSGRIHAKQYIADPWYIQPSLLSRWGFEALRQRFWGGTLPGDDEKFGPQGYIVGELGPKRFKGLGGEEMGRTRERLGGLEGCPMRWR